MTLQPRSDRHLPDILDALYLGSTPAYRDDVLATATRSRQRPAWTFPGRWFPMVEIARQPTQLRRVPWRTLAVAALLLTLLVTALATFVGSRQRLPAPFGPARNGLVSYSSANAMYTVDTDSGATKKIATFDADVLVGDPWFSPDGTRILVTNASIPDNGQNVLWIMNADGSGLKQLTPAPLQKITWNEFSPDGRAVLFVSSVAGIQSISIVNLDGSGSHTLDLGVPVGELAFQPPDGKQILFNRYGDSDINGALYLVNTDGTDLRKLVSSEYKMFSEPVWSPDGSQIAYGKEGKIHIMAADGTTDRILDTGAGWKGWPKWSPDGTRLVIHGDDGAKGVVRVVRVDGTGQPVAINANVSAAEHGFSYEWSPDSSVIFARPNDTLQQELWDPVTGAVRTAPWPATTYPTWQRLAP